MKIPGSDITLFFLKAGGIYLIWYIIYELWLLPDGRLDEWLALNIVSVSGGLLQSAGYDVFAIGRVMGIGNSAGVMLVDGCTGIAAIGLFAGFVAAYPGPRLSRIYFIVFGVGVIYLVNIVRIMVLAVTQAQWPSLFEITHDYSTTAIFYIVIFMLWMLWVNSSDTHTDLNAESGGDDDAAALTTAGL